MLSALSYPNCNTRKIKSKFFIISIIAMVHFVGSCQDGTDDHCRGLGQSDGWCYCDQACRGVGYCCDDKVDICGEEEKGMSGYSPVADDHYTKGNDH